jgi:hypothetical protein
MSILGLRKPVISEGAVDARHRLKPTLSWPHLVALGVGAIVGTGIYTLIGVERIGPDPPWFWPFWWPARSVPARLWPMPKWRR